MTFKPAVLRDLALNDVDEAMTHDLDEHAEQAALGFITALEHACSHTLARTLAGILPPDHPAMRTRSISLVCVAGL